MRCVVFALIRLVPAVALAERVVTRARVVHGVHVRERPTSDSEQVGFLRPGESFELKESRFPGGSLGSGEDRRSRAMRTDFVPSPSKRADKSGQHRPRPAEQVTARRIGRVDRAPRRGPK